MKNKFFSFIILILVVGAVGAYVYFRPDTTFRSKEIVDKNPEVKNIPDVEVILNDLEIPWDIAFLPEGGMLVVERPGRLLFVKDGERKEIAIAGITHAGEGGLLGLTLHPRFLENKSMYLYMSSGYSASETRNRVERYRLEHNSLSDKKIIVEHIPGALYHDGGRMEFGPDGFLYITTGDATRANIAQDKNSLGGKILRVRDDGSIPEGNPFHTAVWSYGHRNPQGIAWDKEGRLWETEHGRTGAGGLVTGMDEVNLITSGQNYGWPEIEGDEVRSGMIAPVINSGASETWAPASLAYLNGSLFFGGLKGEALYEVVLEGEKIKEFKTHFKNEFGRIRTVRVGPDKMLYLTTSNRDGRGKPEAGDDKIIRVNPASLK